MSSPFDLLAESYAAAWSETPKGRGQRGEVWREIDVLFLPGDSILDLGCGTGDDAVHLASRGIEVYGIDSSQGMVDVARARGVDAHWKWIEDLPAMEQRFSGALSNFGALNCLGDLEPVARNLSRVLVPGAPLALCVMGRFCWRESLRFLLKLKLRKAVRRWGGQTVWRGTAIRYWSQGELRRAFDLHFEFRKRVPIGKGDHYLYVLQRRCR